MRPVWSRCLVVQLPTASQLVHNRAARLSAYRPCRSKTVRKRAVPGWQKRQVSRCMPGAAEAHERQKLERLCRYITRPAIAEKRLSLTTQGWVRYQLKTRYRDGTTHVVLEPLDFIARLAALVPRPRVDLTRYHGVFAPNSPQRGEVTPGKRGRRAGVQSTEEAKAEFERRAAMTWAQRLKRVLKIDVETCDECGGAMKVIASIEDPAVIEKILAHLGEADPRSAVSRSRVRPQPRASPDVWD